MASAIRTAPLPSACCSAPGCVADGVWPPALPVEPRGRGEARGGGGGAEVGLGQVRLRCALAGCSLVLLARRNRQAQGAQDAPRARRHRGQLRAVELKQPLQSSASVPASEAENASWRQWATKLGIRADKVDLCVTQDGLGRQLRGMRATAAVGHDEVVISVPADHVLQVTTGGACPLGTAVSAECWRALPWWGQLALLLLHEVAQGPSSPLSPWIQSLPKEFPTIPVNWQDHEVAALGYERLIRSVARQRAELANTFRAAANGSSLRFSEAEFRWAVQVVRSRAFSGPYEGRGAGDRLAQLGLVAAMFAGGVASGALSLENALNGAFVAALTIPLTDFFVGQSAKLKRRVLCPVVDYLNHDSRVSSDIAYEYFANEFAVRVRGGFRAGEAACINYGEERSNDALLQYYGFVEAGCAHDVYELDLLRHLDTGAAARGETLQAKLTRSGPDDRALAQLRRLLADDPDWSTAAAGAPAGADADERLVWRAVALACRRELEELAQHPAEPPGPPDVVSQFRAEKRSVLAACRAHAESRSNFPASSAPLSLATGAVVLPEFRPAAGWRHSWADASLHAPHVARLQADGFCVLPGAFAAGLAERCLAECRQLDAEALACVTTNRCNSGSRSVWLELEGLEGQAAEHRGLAQRLPALWELAHMLAGIPGRADELGGLDGGGGGGAGLLRVHPAVMLAVYPERAAEYVLHKDSYAPQDEDPATGGTRRLTVLAYLNDWREGDGGELRLHEAASDLPDARHFSAVPPSAGCVVLFDSRRMWHAVAPSVRGDRWAVTLWVH